MFTLIRILLGAERVTRSTIRRYEAYGALVKNCFGISSEKGRPDLHC